MTHVRSSGEWCGRLARYRDELAQRPAPRVSGALTRVIGLTLEARGCRLALGERCQIEDRSGRCIDAEAVGFDGEKVFLMPVENAAGLSPDARVVRADGGDMVQVGEGLMGRVIDALGQPLDDGPRLRLHAHTPLAGQPRNPLSRQPITEALDVGVRAINALATVGRGQRMGLFAPSGVGKSTLLGMMTRFTAADVVVVGLIGERGREVGDFVHRVLGPNGLRKAIVVAAPADTPPLMRIHGALRATAIAEYYRDQGKQVLLLMDSLTRFAQAQREIALAIGEPPATKGYTPSVFARLPQLIERAGTGDRGAGSITAVYTILTEDEDTGDPVAYAARAILDGHIVLSRQIAEGGRYPAVDIEASVSRLMSEVVPAAHLQSAQRFREIYARYSQNRELIKMGAYRRGSDPGVDQALELYPQMDAFLRQDVARAAPLNECLKQMQALLPAAQKAA